MSSPRRYCGIQKTDSRLSHWAFALVFVLVAMCVLGSGSFAHAQSTTPASDGWWSQIVTQVQAVIEVAVRNSRTTFSAAVLDIFNPNQSDDPLDTLALTTVEEAVVLLPRSNPAGGSIVFNTPVVVDNTFTVTGALTASSSQFQFLTALTADLTNLAAAQATLADLEVQNTATINSLQVTNEATLSALAVAELARLARLEVSGSASLSNVTVRGTSTFEDMLEARGGITTLGANIDLGDGELYAANVVNEVVAGDNVLVSGTQNRPVISVVTDDLVGVLSLNEETGDIELEEGSDIRINGLEIANRSTLFSVTNRGGCVNCIDDQDVVDALTISGGSINNTGIGMSSAAQATFTTTTVTNLLTVSTTATSTFAGSVNLTGGCFAVNGSCISGATPATYVGLTDTPGSLLAGGLQFASTSGAALTQSSNLTFDGTDLNLGATNGLSIDGTRILGADIGTGVLLLGDSAGVNNEGFELVIAGGYAGEFNTGDYGTLLGYGSGGNNSGDYSTSIGYQSGYNISGNENIAIGYMAASDLTGSYNLALGSSAGLQQSGNYNEMIGYEAGRNLQGSSTVALGAQALRGSGGDAFLASRNVAIGYQAGYAAQTGADNNLLLGYRAGSNLTTGSQNIVIGYDVAVPDSGAANNRLTIGNLIYGTGLDGVGTSTASGSVGIGTSSPSSRLTVAGDIYVTGAWRDGVNTAGDYGDLLVSTGTSTAWMDPSTFGLGDGSYLGLLDTPASYTAHRIPFTNASATAMVDSDNLLFDGDSLAIGSSLLAAPLAVSAQSGTTSAIFWGDTDENKIVFANSTLTDMATIGIVNGGLALSGSGSITVPDMLIDNSGMVGIGTSTPSSQLSVMGDVYVTGAWRDGVNASGVDGDLLVSTGTSTAWVDPAGFGLGDGTFLGLIDTPDNYLANAITYATSAANALTQSSDFVYTGSRLGVGTDNPMSTLTVRGDMSALDAGAVRLYDASSTGYVGFRASSTVATSTIWTLPETDGDLNQLLVTDGEGNLLFEDITAVGGGATTYLGLTDTPSSYTPFSIPYVNTAGDALTQANDFVFRNERLGLGVSNPNSKLVVQGDVRFQISDSQPGMSYLTASNRFGFGTNNPTDLMTLQGGSFTQRGGASGAVYSPSQRAGVILPTETNDVAVVGDYIYAVTGATGDDFHVIDIRNPLAPTEVASIPLAAGATAVAVAGKYAYVTSEINGDDFHVIDISDPLDPVEVAGVELPTSAQSLALQGRYAYVGTSNVGTDFHVIDVSDPLNPVEVDAIEIDDSVQGIAVAGQYAYAVSAVQDDDFHVIDISDPTNVVEVGWLDLPASANDIDVVGLYAYVTTNATGDDFHIIDISDPLVPIEVGSVDLDASANTVAVTGRYAYIGTQSLGNDIYVVDVLDPTTPVIIGQNDLGSGNILGIAVSGRYAFLGSSNAGSSVAVVDISGAEVQSLQAGTFSAGEMLVRGDAVVAGTLSGGLGVRAGVDGLQTDGELFALGDGTSYIAGRVGIGTSTPTAKLTVDGTVQASNLFGGAVGLETDANGNIIRAVSDARLKENVTTIEGALEQVLQLRGVRYEWIDTDRFGEQVEIGFLAQEVDEVVPEVVRKGGEYWSLNTRNLIAVVVEAIKELWQTVQGNQTEIEELRERIEVLERSEAKTSTNDTAADKDANESENEDEMTTMASSTVVSSSTSATAGASSTAASSTAAAATSSTQSTVGDTAAASTTSTTTTDSQIETASDNIADDQTTETAAANNTDQTRATSSDEQMAEEPASNDNADIEASVEVRDSEQSATATSTGTE